MLPTGYEPGVQAEQVERTLTRMAAYIRRHAGENANLFAWADFIEALPADGEEALAFARSQREIGFPDPFTPRCDDGLYMRTYGLADRPPPDRGTLRELVALEGMEEPLAPGAYFPVEPTPVRDGLPLWAVEVRVISDDPALWERWEHAYDLTHPRLEQVRGYGVNELPDEQELYSTELQLWAADEAEARALAEPLVDSLMGAARGRRRLDVTPAYRDDYHRLPRRPEDYESKLVKKRWQRFEPSSAGVKLVWWTGPCALERVDVDETDERVTITLSERYPPAFAEGGDPIEVVAIGRIRCVEVTLAQPLAGRAVIDGATGRPPDELDDFDDSARNTREWVLACDLDTLDCTPFS